MRRLAQRSGRARPARTGMLALSVALLATIGLTACGSSSTSAPASVVPSVPATSQTPPVSTPAATTSPTPTASPKPGAASSTPVPGDVAKSFDACALLTTADLAKIFGNGRVQAQPMPGGGWVAGQCVWNGPTSGFFLGVGTAASIAAFGDPAAANAKARLAQFKSASGTGKDVAGIGDGAVASSNGIAAYKGGTYLEITNLGLTSEQLIKIAKLAVARL